MDQIMIESRRRPNLRRCVEHGGRTARLEAGTRRLWEGVWGVLALFSSVGAL